MNIAKTITCFILVLLFVLLISCTNHSKPKYVYKTDSTTKKFIKIWFSNLFNYSASYNNQIIETEGYYKGAFEQSALFRNKRGSNLAEAFWIDFGMDSLKEIQSNEYLFESHESMKKILNKKIKVRGLFTIDEKGHLSQYAGTIKNISYIEIY